MKNTKFILATGLCALSLIATTTLITSCTSKYHEESTGQYVDSSAITLKVKTRLLEDNGLKNLSINVKTYKNIVQLSGFVDTLAQKQRAVEITRNVPGVAAVKDSLIVK